MSLLGIADVEDVAAAKIVAARRDTTNHDRAAVYLLAVECIDRRPEGVAPGDAQPHWRFLAVEGLGRPFDILGEVEQKTGLDLRLAEGLCLQPRRAARQRQQHADRNARPDWESK